MGHFSTQIGPKSAPNRPAGPPNRGERHFFKMEIHYQLFKHRRIYVAKIALPKYGTANIWTNLSTRGPSRFPILIDFLVIWWCFFCFFSPQNCSDHFSIRRKIERDVSRPKAKLHRQPKLHRQHNMCYEQGHGPWCAELPLPCHLQH